MGEIAIRVEELSKRYRIGVRSERYDTLRDRIAAVFRWPLPASGRSPDDARAADTIWALKDISLEVRRGEVLGIIGRNGAGKSTLLKILSRITEPTTGRIQLYGRVGSLLEVGTGFHGELTGRENIYLNGAILGMRKTEIARKFDEIVAFAEVEKFLDTPVKRYSSGMYMRLAFAVAAHLEPEILIVDEVLAVGDAAFQKKCLGKMSSVAREGRTVLFVSHNMASVSRLCERVVLLDRGSVLDDGPSHKVIAEYSTFGLRTSGAREWPDGALPGGSVARLRAVRVRRGDGTVTDTVAISEPVTVEMEYEVLESGHKLLPNFDFYNDQGVHVFSAYDVDPAWRGRPRPAGRYVSTVEIPPHFLSDGRLMVAAGLDTLEPVTQQFGEVDAVAFEVLDDFAPDSARGDYLGPMGGVVRPRLAWHTRVLG